MNNHVLNVCKIGKFTSCCRYLIVGSKGFECAKNNPTLKPILDKRVEDIPEKVKESVKQADVVEEIIHDEKKSTHKVVTTTKIRNWLGITIKEVTE